MTTTSSLFAVVPTNDPNSVLITDGAGMVTEAPNNVTTVEYAANTTGDVQSQIDGKETLLNGSELMSIQSVPVLGGGNISLDGVPFLSLVRDPFRTLNNNTSYICPDGRSISLVDSPRLKSWLGKTTRKPEISFLGREPYFNPALPGPKYQRLEHDGTNFISWDSNQNFSYSSSGDYWTNGLPSYWPSDARYICIHHRTNTWLATFYNGVGNTGIKISTDKGTTWTTRTFRRFSNDNKWSACGFSDGVIVVCDWETAWTGYSSDMGVTWNYGENVTLNTDSEKFTAEGLIRHVFSYDTGPLVGTEATSTAPLTAVPPNANWIDNKRYELYTQRTFTPGTSTYFSDRNAVVTQNNQYTYTDYYDTTGTMISSIAPIVQFINCTGAYYGLHGSHFPYETYGKDAIDYRTPFSVGNGRANGMTMPPYPNQYSYALNPNIQFAYVQAGIGGYSATTGTNWEFFDIPGGFSSDIIFPYDERLKVNPQEVRVPGSKQVKICVSRNGNITLMVNPSGQYIVWNTTVKSPTEAKIPNINGDVGTGGDKPPPSSFIKIL